MPQDDQPAKKNKGNVVAFRVDEDSFNEIENRAALAGTTANDWCRDELLARLAEVVPLTANEELIHAEIIRYGNVLVTFLSMLAKDELTPENAGKLLGYLNLDRKKISTQYFARIGKEMREEGK
jgi:hypothetical protein